MDENLDRQEGVITFQEERVKKEEPAKKTVTPAKKEESLGRNLIAVLSIGVVGMMFAGAIATLGPTTTAGAICWLVTLGIVALIGKWAKWF